ncbi:MAG: 1-acyl-sn-glycerol-3-phosphate acyltransferase [Desulfobacteraceae bacterium]|nr:1-acyl-sn-glycerol-3-phosphate acyltransferase [Desulfobacteraceae bacterium]
MAGEITISLWVFIILIAFAIIAALDKILIPSSRWFLRRRINIVLKEIGTRLDIEIRPFQLTKRQVLLDRLAYDPEVIKAIQEHAKEYDMPVEMAQKKVMIYAKEIVPSFNAYFYFRIGYWIAKKIARLLYRVRVDLLKNEQYNHIDPDSTVVFVMNHRSNMDYVLVAFLAAERTTLSYAVGEWAKIWPLHMLFRFMGAFFVRRNSKNPLYRRVLERYIHMATKEGVCQAVFLEGGLSRDGRLQSPKLGLMDYMLRQFDPKNDRNIVFIPVGINYDRTVEDRTLLRSMEPKVAKKSLWFVVKTTLGFIFHSIVRMVLSQWKRYGYACVNFGTPVSIKNYCDSHSVDFKKLARQERFIEIEKLSKKLLSEIGDVIPIVPISLVATVFVKNMEQGLTIFDIEEQVTKLLSTLQERGAPVLEVPRSTQTNATADAVDMLSLRKIITISGSQFRANLKEEKILQYYANSIAHWL